MAIYLECPKCLRKQNTEHKLCIKYQHDLVIARKKKTAAYWVYVKLKKKQAWERIGPSLTIARERERTFRKEIEEKRYLAKHETLIDFYTDVFLPYSKREKRSYGSDEYHFVHVVKHFGADTRLTDITPEDVENYKEIRTQEGRKNATVNRELALLRAIINKADKMGRFIGKNPVSKLLPENNSHIARSLSEDEARKLFAELNADTKPVFEFALATGIRIGNIMTMKWTQIDMAHRMIHLPLTKSGRAITIPINNWAVDIVKKLARHIKSPYVFVKVDGTPYKNLHHGFKAALKRAGMDTTIRIHDLRHSAATWLAASGVPTAVLKDLLGHSSMAMVARYQHTGHATMLEMANKITSPFGNVSNNRLISEENEKIRKV